MYRFISDINFRFVFDFFSSVFGFLIVFFPNIKSLHIVTPLDVVKIRLQAQQKEFMKNKCFVYCNGLMDHVCYCLTNGGNNNINNNNNNSKFNGKQINFCQINGQQSNKQTINFNYFHSFNNNNNNTKQTKTNAKCLYHSLSTVKHLTDKQIHDLWYRRPNYFNGTMVCLYSNVFNKKN